MGHERPLEISEKISSENPLKPEEAGYVNRIVAEILYRDWLRRKKPGVVFQKPALMNRSAA